MKFLRNSEGIMVCEAGHGEILDNKPLSTAFIVDVPRIKESIKEKGRYILRNPQYFAVAPVAVSSGGVFWDAFLTYIFPWMLDIAKVYCLVRISQAFYEEKRGGRDSGTGFSALIQHGKWYLVFWLLPLGVELIDQIGSTMFHDMQGKTVIKPR